MVGKIFISYRRSDEAGHTGRLAELLASKFGPDRLFFDVDDIEPGSDFSEIIDQQVKQSAALIAVIGPRWVDLTDDKGRRKLDNPHDIVRFEIETAIREKKLIIPVLIGQARMPTAEELPETLASFAKRNAVRLTHEGFKVDSARLVARLQKVVEPGETGNLQNSAEILSEWLAHPGKTLAALSLICIAIAAAFVLHSFGNKAAVYEKAFVQVAGPMGIVVGSVLLVFRDVIRRNIFSALSRRDSYRLMRLIIGAAWSIAIIGLLIGIGPGIVAIQFNSHSSSMNVVGK